MTAWLLIAITALLITLVTNVFRPLWAQMASDRMEDAMQSESAGCCEPLSG